MQPTKLFSKGIVTGFRRGQRNQTVNTSLVKIEGVTTKKVPRVHSKISLGGLAERCQGMISCSLLAGARNWWAPGIPHRPPNLLRCGASLGH